MVADFGAVRTFQTVRELEIQMVNRLKIEGKIENLKRTGIGTDGGIDE
jgi:hypothetical protein